MTLLRWSLVCALMALTCLIAYVSHSPNAALGFYLFITCSVALGSLGAFVFKNY